MPLRGWLGPSDEIHTHGIKNILHHLEVVRALSDKRFPSYERFREEVIFRKCEFAFSWGFFVFFCV